MILLKLPARVSLLAAYLDDIAVVLPDAFEFVPILIQLFLLFGRAAGAMLSLL